VVVLTSSPRSNSPIKREPATDDLQAEVSANAEKAARPPTCKGRLIHRINNGAAIAISSSVTWQFRVADRMLASIGKVKGFRQTKKEKVYELSSCYE
jgi:hypothetical protein